MKKRILCGFFAILIGGCAAFGFSACGGKEAKVGVSFGAGPAKRWALEKVYMEEKAATLDMKFEVKMNLPDSPTTQAEDCKALVDSGIDVLIIMPRNADDSKDIISYARNKGVKVISYARVILNTKIDLFVGYDSYRIGQSMGLFLSELAYSGDYIILKGDPSDNNAALIHKGAMEYIDDIRGSINVVEEAAVPNWSAETAKAIVKEAVIKNDYHIDAILAPNDTLAGAAVQALQEIEAEFGVKNTPSITGMDAELSAVRRIARDQQAMTVYMDLQQLAQNAVEQAYNMAKGLAPKVNALFDNPSGGQIDSNLITGQIVTKENINRILIDSGQMTWQDVYGE